MKLFRLLLAPLFLLSIAFAQRDQELRKELEPLYRKWITAYQQERTADVLALMDPEFTWMMHDGATLNRKESEAAIADLFANTENGKWMMRISGVTGFGSVANVTIEYTFTGQLLDAAKKPYDGQIQGTERQVWYKGELGWKQRKADVLSSKTVSGKEVVSSAAQGEKLTGAEWFGADPPQA